jgi:predicted dithiol-disulfide oxidoreductase (DUF899 family)
MDAPAPHRTTNRDEWEAARAELLAREKEHPRVGDELARQRRELPWLRLDKEYRLEIESGTRTFAELFDGRSQLLVYHFMFGPSYEAGCPTCSSIADSFDGVIPHLRARDATMICISRAPIEKLAAYKRRMRWSFEWASSADSDFNFDLGVSRRIPEIKEMLGVSSALTDAQVRERVGPIMSELPPIAGQNAQAAGHDEYA